ncbi:MAG: hypothetical protein FD130_1193 [Halothiobacillaceae bacterium]|nr:MAG: hypothetical protein FD130_1193 [Halothiobacillaceae bacterium]
MSLSRRLLMLLSCCLGLLAYQSALAFSCDGGIVTKGSNKITVRSKCGDPSWIDRWHEEITEHRNSDIEHQISQVNERWIYNLGPNKLIHIVTFKGSVVLSTETGGRGFTVVPGMRRCDFNTISLETTSGEIATRCGEPDLKEQRYETVSWTFDLGSARFMRILTFRNGKLVDIRTGEKGAK